MAFSDLWTLAWIALDVGFAARRSWRFTHASTVLPDGEPVAIAGRRHIVPLVAYVGSMTTDEAIAWMVVMG